MPDESESVEKLAAEPYEGVRGWLLCLCIIFTVLVPFAGAANLINNFLRVQSDFEYVKGLEKFMFVNIGLRLFVVIFSMHAGITLWSENPKAVRTAKAYLWSFLCVLVVAIAALFIMVDWPPSAWETLRWEIAREIAMSLAYFAVCYTYLCKSKRVKATYPDYRS